MKVLMTADTLGGVWNYAVELTQALGRFNVEVALATMGRPLTDDQWRVVRQIPNIEVFESAYRLCWMQDPWADVEKAGHWLLQVAERVRPAVIHLNDYAHGALPWPAPVLIAGHSCVLSWWEAVRKESPPAEWSRYRAVVKRGLHAADWVTAPSSAMLSALNRLYGPLSRRQVIPNGRRPMIYAPPRKRPVVLAAGRLWDEAKNIAALAEAAPSLPWPVYIAGEDRHPDGGRRSLSNVQLLGRLPPAELIPWFERASLYALPARYEPFGLSALEAASAGCALVLGDIPSLREIWQDAAWFVPPDDSRSLQQALQILIEDAGLRAHYARLAQARSGVFTSERMAAAYWKVYRRLIGEGRPLPIDAVTSLDTIPIPMR